MKGGIFSENDIRPSSDYRFLTYTLLVITGTELGYCVVSRRTKQAELPPLKGLRENGVFLRSPIQDGIW